MSGWEPYIPMRRKKQLSGCVSVRANSMTVAEDVANVYFHEKGQTYALLMFNKAAGLAAIKPNRKQGLHVRTQGKSKAITLQAKSFIKAYRIAIGVYPLTWDEDKLTFNPTRTKPLDLDDDEE